MAKLGEPDLLCAELLVGHGKSACSVAKDLGVDQGTLRYRLARRREGAADGRSRPPEACVASESVIPDWIERQA